MFLCTSFLLIQFDTNLQNVVTIHIILICGASSSMYKIITYTTHTNWTSHVDGVYYLLLCVAVSPSPPLVLSKAARPNPENLYSL
jgi:hypothetical protein